MKMYLGEITEEDYNIGLIRFDK